MATDEEVQKKIKSVNDLRRKISDTATKSAVAINETANDAQMRLLEQEEARLQSQLETVKSPSKTELKHQVEAVTAGPVAPELDAQTVVAEEKE